MARHEMTRRTFTFLIVGQAIGLVLCGNMERKTNPIYTNRARGKTKAMSGIQATGKRKQDFLKSYREHGTVTSAAKITGISRRTVYLWRHEDQGFEEELETIRETLIEVLEKSLYLQALDGDTQAAMFLLKAFRPEVYRDRYEIRNVNATEVDTEGARERLEQKLTAIEVKGR